MMEKASTEYWQKRLHDFLKEEKMEEPEFHNFMNGKIKRLPLLVEEFGWGVFPLTDEEGILVDIRMIVPMIYDEKSLCVNIHEYVHAYEAYSRLGRVYKWHIEESEQNACNAEKRYLNRKSLYL